MGGKFVMIDGLEGSGKGTVLDTLKNLYDHVFDLGKHTKEHKSFPKPEDIKQEVIFSVEPTYGPVGRAIREELLRTDYSYSALTAGHAFALDREILYNRLLIPLKKQGKTIIQERGIVSSLVYQPVQHEKLSLRELMNIQGNKIAIKNAPDLLIIIKADPDAISKRHGGRMDSLFLQRKIQERFESSWLKQVFERFGCKVIYLDGNCSAEELKEKTIALAKDHLL